MPPMDRTLLRTGHRHTTYQMHRAAGHTGVYSPSSHRMPPWLGASVASCRPSVVEVHTVRTLKRTCWDAAPYRLDQLAVRSQVVRSWHRGIRAPVQRQRPDPAPSAQQSRALSSRCADDAADGCCCGGCGDSRGCGCGCGCERRSSGCCWVWRKASCVPTRTRRVHWNRTHLDGGGDVGGGCRVDRGAALCFCSCCRCRCRHARLCSDPPHLHSRPHHLRQRARCFLSQELSTERQRTRLAALQRMHLLRSLHLPSHRHPAAVSALLRVAPAVAPAARLSTTPLSVPLPLSQLLMKVLLLLLLFHRTMKRQ